MTDEQIDDLLGQIDDARERAAREASSVFDFIDFRGFQILGITVDDERSEDYWGFPTDQVNLSVSDLRNVFIAAEQRPKIAKLVIYVGYNGAEYEEGLRNDYEPEAGFEDLTIWERAKHASAGV